MSRWSRLIRVGLPLVALVLLAALLLKGLQSDPRILPSALIGKPAPVISLPTLAGDRTFQSEQMRGRVWILNVFASWCAACVTEHTHLLNLAARQEVTLVGLAYKDKPADTDAWLRRYGNPFHHVALDTGGRVGMDYGVYGVPETYVIDAAGVIVLRKVGPIDATFFQEKVAPLLKPVSAATVKP